MAEQQPPANRIQLKSWNIVSEWCYINSLENCTICHHAMTDKCIQCQKGSTQGECEPGWGKCPHSFHRHCLVKWLVKHNTCPLCAREWEWSN